MTKTDPIRLYLSKRTKYVDVKVETVKCPDIVIVIPCHNEDRIVNTLESLRSNNHDNIYAHVIVVINHGKSADDSIKKNNYESYSEILDFQGNLQKEEFTLQVIKAFNLPDKKAGVGLARKLGMDHACEIYNYYNQDGVIACFDADSLCDCDYIYEVYQHFISSPKVDGISIKFEHPKSGSEFDSSIYKAIDQYEKHLNYYIDIQKYINLPFAIHTVGSSMAVKASSYAKFGGMNMRKAGEDFYFLQKFIENGVVEECNTTKVIPSPRISKRVPFGTGKAVGDITSNSDLIYYTYNPESFRTLSGLVESLPKIFSSEESIYTYPLHEGLIDFLTSINFDEKIIEAKSNTTNYNGFKKRFFKHFNAFQLMKYVHFMRDHYFPNIPVDEALQKFKNLESVGV